MTGKVVLRAASPADVDAITACVRAAYGPYIERMGKAPGPMLEDYAAVVVAGEATVAERDGSLVGVLVVRETDEGFLLDNIAVDPAHHGTGCGRALLVHAEHLACAAGYDSIYLYTHETMVENVVLYERIGYSVYARRTVNGYERVYMRKPLA